MHTWKVLGVQAFPNLNGKLNVVHSVHWELGPIDVITELNPPSGEFVPFDALTEDVVLNWVWGRTPKADWEARAAKAEEAAKAPAPEAVKVSLPWA